MFCVYVKKSSPMTINVHISCVYNVMPIPNSLKNSLLWILFYRQKQMICILRKPHEQFGLAMNLQQNFSQNLNHSCVSIVCQLCLKIFFQMKDISETLPYHRINICANISIKVAYLVLRIRTWLNLHCVRYTLGHQLL